jgi:hypothetical protein
MEAWWRQGSGTDVDHVEVSIAAHRVEQGLADERKLVAHRRRRLLAQHVVVAAVPLHLVCWRHM